MATIFSRIIAGEIPSYRIYEDELTYAFLDIHPVARGHTLIVPKIEVDHFMDVPEPYYSAVFQTAKIVAQALKASTGKARIGTIIAGFAVPHFHYHLVPIDDESELDSRLARTYTDDEMRAIQASILRALPQ